MKKINDYLKEQALLEKQYSEELLIPGSVNSLGIINSIDESFLDISFEAIDNYITESLSTSMFSTDTKGYWDNIFETLIKSHDYNKLINKLKEYFGNNWSASYEVNYAVKSKTKSFEFYLKNCDIAKKIQTYVENKKFDNIENNDIPEDLIHIMNFFNYYFSSVKPSYMDGEITSYKILCEPKYSDKENDLVYKTYNGILYHVTLKENVDRILKRGLQVKGNKNLYRYIEPRINFILGNDDTKELEDRIKTIVQQKGYKKDDYQVLKIDLNYGKKNKFNNSSYSIDFYHDNMYSENWSVYTYGLIHPRFISIYGSVNEGNEGQNIDDDWINNEKPVQTKDGRQAIITKIDLKEVPNIIHGQVKMKDKLFDYEWDEDGICIKAIDQYGNPKKPDEADMLVKVQ